jgi:hypothetical protein
MITKWLLVFAGVLACWIALMAMVMRFSDAAPAAVVFFPSDDFIGTLPEDITILSSTSMTITLSSEQREFGAALYQAGAKLVLPAGLTGCLPLP